MGLTESCEPDSAEDDFRNAVVAGLSRPRKAIPCQYLYDAQGSALFDEITRLPEYYLTRTEIGILEDCAPRIARLVGPHALLVELGSGSSDKIRLLLDLLDAPAGYVAVDISGEHLRRATAALGRDHPALRVMALCADYTQPFALPSGVGSDARKRVAFFPGSTIGNLEPDPAVELLRSCAAMVGPGGELLIGIDLKKDRRTLEAAYNDARGVTAAFSLNLLARINRELGGDFRLERFAHDASYDAAAGRIEIHLRSLADQTVEVAGHRFSFAEGERVHTEYSYKYAMGEFRSLAARAGWRAVESWTDAKQLFAVHYLNHP